MKSMVSILFVLIFLLSLFGCGEANMNPGVDTQSLFDDSAGQQRFLTRPDASIIINPKSYMKNAETGKMGDGALNLGLVDNTGEVPEVKAEIDNVMFFLEDNTSNGKGGKVLFQTDFSALTNLTCDEKVVKYQANGNNISFCVYDNGKNTASFWAPLNFKNGVKCDFSKQIMCYVNILKCEQSCSLKFTPAAKPEVIVKPDGFTEGFLTFNLTELLGVKGENKNITMNFFAIGFDKYVTFDRLDIIEYDPGMHFSGNEAPVSSSWTPYSIRSQTLYPNGLNIETTDYVIGSNGVVRNYRAISGGSCIIAGKFEGKASYEKNLGIIIEGKDASYVIVSKRKTVPLFFAAETDFLTKTNGSENAVSESGYWSMDIGALANDTESQVAVYMGSTVAEAKAFAENAKSDMTAISKESFIEENVLYWDTYLSGNPLPSPYIINSPVTE